VSDANLANEKFQLSATLFERSFFKFQFKALGFYFISFAGHMYSTNTTVDSD
jgi:hypothetical protein